jgi:site-specific recombinase XerD
MTTEVLPTIFIDAVDMLQLGVNGQSKRAYTGDVVCFKRWLDEHRIDAGSLTYSVMARYRAYLLEEYASATASRRWKVVRLLLDKAVKLKLLSSNPAREVEEKIKVEDSVPHTALSKNEIKRLLAAVDTSTSIGKRNYALVLLLVYTGLRRSEVASLVIGDISSKQEHMVLTVRSGKGKKFRDVPLRAEVFRAVKDYLEATDRLNASLDSPLFCGFYRGDTPRPTGITSVVVLNVVQDAARKAGLVNVTPHCIRASFIPFAIDTGSPVIKVQRLVGHASPVTTENYYSRKTDLDESPIYKITLDV